MATKTASTPDNRLAEALELAEVRRAKLNELAVELNERGLQVEQAQSAEAAANERAEALEAEVAKLRDGWTGREGLLEEAVTRANEATALAAAATAARVQAEDELGTTSVLLAEAKASVDRLTPENAALRGQVAGYEARVRQAEEQLAATVEAAKQALDRVAEAAVQAIAPTAQSLREQVLALAQSVPEDGDQSEFLASLRGHLVEASRDSLGSGEDDRKAKQAQAEMVRRVAGEASAKLKQDVAAVMGALR
jgi:hypothetical protein